MSNVICNGDCTEFTVAFTFFTSDTAVGADLACTKSIFLAGACNIGALSKRDQLQNILRADFCACTTANAKIIIYMSNVIYDIDCIVWAGFYTIAISKTGKITACASAIVHFCNSTALTALIIHDVIGCAQMSAAFYNRTFCLDSANLYPEDRTDLGSYCCAADSTKVWLCFAFCELCSIFITAGASACTAVCARKDLTNFYSCFIHFHSKDFGCDGKDKTGNQADNSYDTDWQHNAF